MCRSGGWFFARTSVSSRERRTPPHPIARMTCAIRGKPKAISDAFDIGLVPAMTAAATTLLESSTPSTGSPIRLWIVSAARNNSVNLRARSIGSETSGRIALNGGSLMKARPSALAVSSCCSGNTTDTLGCFMSLAPRSRTPGRGKHATDGSMPPGDKPVALWRLHRRTEYLRSPMKEGKIIRARQDSTGEPRQHRSTQRRGLDHPGTTHGLSQNVRLKLHQVWIRRCAAVSPKFLDACARIFLHRVDNVAHLIGNSIERRAHDI